MKYARTGAVAIVVALILGAISCTTAAGRAGARAIGQPVDPRTLAAIDRDIAPDGTGLPAGSASARTGARLFAASCLSCHGVAINLRRDRWVYATSLYDYINRAMPPGRAEPLPPADVYALTAYLLAVNHVIGPDDILDRTTLPRVVMPDRDHFVTP